MKDAIITSALIEVTFATLLGWPLNRFRSGQQKVGPFHSAKRLLQAHLDYIFMSMLQLGIAAVHPAIPRGAALLLIAGSWSNPTLFLLGAILPPEEQRKPYARMLAFVSFLSLTVAYPWLLAAWVLR